MRDLVGYIKKDQELWNDIIIGYIVKDITCG
jgi:hypothetical protein